MASAPIDLTREALCEAPMCVLNFDVGITNMGVCKVARDARRAEEGHGFPFRVEYWELIDLGTGNGPVAGAVSAMVRMFLGRPQMYRGVTDVAIESQGIARDHIKALAAAMQAHFETLSRARSPLLDKGPVRIHIVSPANKLKVCSPENLEAYMELHCGDGFLPAPFRRKRARKSASQQSETDMEKRRQQNKKAAEFHCAAVLSLIDDGDVWTAWLAQHSKIDDLCDAFLQGCYVLQNEKQYGRAAKVV